MNSDGVRERSYGWSDPMVSAAAVSTTTGLDLLRAIVAGELPPPPVAATVGMTAVEVQRGRVVFQLQPREFHYNPIGSVHGGMLATVLDSAAGCAVHSTLPAGMGYTSLDLVTRFLRPVSVDSGALTCEGAVLSGGRRTAFAESRLTDASGRLVAHASSTCLLFPLEAAS